MAIAHIQAATPNNAWAASSPATFTLTGVTATHSLICAFTIIGTSMAAATSVIDSAGDTWTRLVQTTQNTAYSSQNTEIWWRQSASAGTHTLTVTFPGTSYGAFGVITMDEFSGIASVDVAAAVVTATATTATVTTSAASQSGDLAYVLCTMPTAGSGITDNASAPWVKANASGVYQFTDYQIMPSTAAVTTTWTQGASDAYATISILFSPAATGGANPSIVQTGHTNIGAASSGTVTMGANFTALSSGVLIHESANGNNITAVTGGGFSSWVSLCGSVSSGLLGALEAWVPVGLSTGGGGTTAISITYASAGSTSDECWVFEVANCGTIIGNINTADVSTAVTTFTSTALAVPVNSLQIVAAKTEGTGSFTVNPSGFTPETMVNATHALAYLLNSAGGGSVTETYTLSPADAGAIISICCAPTGTYANIVGLLMMLI